MRRRDLLATLAGAGLSATAGCSALLSGGSDEQASDAITVETLDAPGSEAGTATVPARDRVSFVEFFATTCSVCAAQMPRLRTAHERVGADVQFLSVTSEPVGLTVSRGEVVSWWADHDGAWPVAVDDGTVLARRYDATSVPKAVVLAPDGTVTWSHTGAVEASAVVEAIEDAAGELA
ncbi:MULTISPECIES: TlpA family protein disulfide reductase [Salinibaculum]|uniref:TlpA family protein disulfide reductase n=1 Tax=Salinibaculum TaxID=2732368 RepID=UPI0030CD83A3